MTSHCKPNDDPSMMNGNRIGKKRSRTRPSTTPSNSISALLVATGSALLLASSHTSAFSGSNDRMLHTKLLPTGAHECPWNSGSFTSLFAATQSTSTSFRRSTSSSSRRSASSSSQLMVEPMKPLTPTSSVSKERREAARDAFMKERTSVESALEGVDAQVLELLSEDYLYPRHITNGAAPVAASTVPGREQQRRQPLSYRRPSGRPELVPGAMTRASMKRYREKRDLIHHLVQGSKNGAFDVAVMNTESRQSQSTTSQQQGERKRNPPSPERISLEALKEELKAQLHVQSREVDWKTKQRIGLRGTTDAIVDSNNDEDTSGLPGPSSAVASTSDDNKGIETAPKKSRKRAVKNLPKRKEVPMPIDQYGTQESQPDSTSGSEDIYPSTQYDARRRGKNSRSGSGEINNLELRKYYATELLTPDQEYDLGQKIQMLIACEQVHEGLSIDLMRLPTIKEWATACGYVEEDHDFNCDSILEHQLRPAGSENMFEETDPNLFIGNGLAHTIGVGRGRGRVKKPPPNKLKDMYDEREVGKPKHKRIPLNRGTPTRFCEMIIDGRNAKQLMVQSNMRLVVSISRKYTKVGISLQDLVQEGSLGLSRAAEKYDPTKGFKFSTYASWWIQQAVFRSIAYHSRTIRLPVHIHNMLNRVRKVRNALQQGLGRPPTDEEMADAMDMPPSRYRRMIRLTRKSISLELPHYMQNAKDYGHEGDDTIGDMTSASGLGNMDSEIVSPEQSVDRSLFHQDLKEMLTILNDDERKVIELRYGLHDGLTRTVTSVAAEMKQTPGWIRSQESRALRKLRRPWYEKKLMEHQHALIN